MTTDVVKAIVTGGDYPDFDTWITARKGDIRGSGRDTNEIGEVYGLSNPGSLFLTSADWLTDDTHKVIVRAAPGEECGGVFSTMKAHISGTVGEIRTIRVYGVNCVIGPGLSIEETAACSNNSFCVLGSGVAPGDGRVIIDGCIFRGGSYSPDVFAALDISEGIYTIKNCVIFCQSTGTAADEDCGICSNDAVVDILNSVIVAHNSDASSFGIINFGGSTINTQNDYIDGDVAYGEGYDPIAKGLNDATSDGSALTPALRLIPRDGTVFVDPSYAGMNFRLVAGSPLIDKGATLAGVPVDFVGTHRPQGVAYDIGAHERLSAGGHLLLVMGL